YLLGGRFTLADASAYGQLSMNLTDPAAARCLGEIAPCTLEWLRGVRERRHVGSAGPLFLSPRLGALLDVFTDTFVPLMRANEGAFEKRAEQQTVFNERAFERGIALFDSVLLGWPYRSVVKTFQVRAWRDLRRDWLALAREDRDQVSALLGNANLDEAFAPQ
ncbi:MAG: hypothetical protein ABR587_08790, partial [Candidatus Binatia bacterium]